MRVIITTGRTVERITSDGVNITNGFTGQQGQEIARAFLYHGAHTILISGPTLLKPVPGVHLRSVHTLSEMQQAVLKEIEIPTDIYVSAAAISDFRIEQPISLRLQPGEKYSLPLIETPSLLRIVSQHPTYRPTFVVGFAAQSKETLLPYAQKKFETYGCNLIIANAIGDGSASARDTTRNAIYFLFYYKSKHIIESVGEGSKAEIAQAIVQKILSLHDDC